METPTIPHDLISPIEAAHLLQTSPDSIRRWCKSGKLPAYKLVGTLRISRADALALLKRVETKGPLVRTRAEVTAQAEWVDKTLREAGIRK